MIYLFAAGSDYRYFEIEQASGRVTIKKLIPEDELLQPATLVVRVSTQHFYFLKILLVANILLSNLILSLIH